MIFAIRSKKCRCQPSFTRSTTLPLPYRSVVGMDLCSNLTLHSRALPLRGVMASVTTLKWSTGQSVKRHCSTIFRLLSLVSYEEQQNHAAKKKTKKVYTPITKN